MKVILFLLLGLSAAYAQSAGELFRQGRELDQKNQNQEALGVLLQADELTPHDGETLRLIAKQYSQLILESNGTTEKKMRGEKALAYGLQAVEVAPNNADAHLTLAIIYGRIALEAPARRKVELSKMIEEEAALAARLDPQLDYAWHVLGRWNYELANFNPVLKALAQAIYGKFPAASNEKAVEYFQKAIAIAPRRVLHHVELGRTYLALNEKSKAREEFEKGLALPSFEKDDEETKRRARRTLLQIR